MDSFLSVLLISSKYYCIVAKNAAGMISTFWNIKILAWPKYSLGFLCNILWKNLNKFVQLNIFSYLCVNLLWASKHYIFHIYIYTKFFFFFFNIYNVCLSCSVMFDSVTSWTVACQAPLFMEFSRQECWSGLSFPSPGYLPNPRIESTSPALARGFFNFWATQVLMYT